MDVTRRNFIKTIGIGSLMLSLPPINLLKSKYPDFLFDPQKQYGNFIFIHEFDREILNITINILSRQIVDVVPKEFRKRTIINVIKPNSFFHDPLGKIGSVAWKTIPINRRMPSKRIIIQ